MWEQSDDNVPDDEECENEGADEPSGDEGSGGAITDLSKCLQLLHVKQGKCPYCNCDRPLRNYRVTGASGVPGPSLDWLLTVSDELIICSYCRGMLQPIRRLNAALAAIVIGPLALLSFAGVGAGVFTIKQLVFNEAPFSLQGILVAALVIIGGTLAFNKCAHLLVDCLCRNRVVNLFVDKNLELP
jgi:hypothetical protein